MIPFKKYRWNGWESVMEYDRVYKLPPLIEGRQVFETKSNGFIGVWAFSDLFCSDPNEPEIENLVDVFKRLPKPATKDDRYKWTRGKKNV